MKSFSFVLFLVFMSLERTTDNLILKFLPLFSLIAYVLLNLRLRRRVNEFKVPIIIYLFIFMIFVGVFRSSDPNSSVLSEINKIFVYFLTIFSFCQALSISLHRRYKIESIFVWLFFIPLFGLIIINLLGFSLGLSSLSTDGMDLGQSLILGKLGITLNRVSFPFSTGFNTYASIVGILLLVSLFGIRFLIGFRFLMILGAVLSTITLILIDTRSALFYPYIIFIGFSLFFSKNNKPRFLFLIPFLLLYGPFLLTWTLSVVSQMQELSFLSRSSEDFTTANSRTIIWLLASIEFLEFKPIHLFGFGEYGHFSSGASALWSDIFGRWGDSSLLITPHSSFFSILYDYGYLGLVLVIVLQLKVLVIVKNIWSSMFSLSLILLSILIYWNMIGIVETFFGFYTPNILIIFIMVCIFVYFIKIYLLRHKVGHPLKSLLLNEN